MERKLLCQLFTATKCSTLAQHALKLIYQTTFDSVLFKSLLSHAGQLSCCEVTQTTQMLEASCLFSFKSILLRTSEKFQSIKRTACMLNFIYIVQSKWYLRLKISVQGPFNSSCHALPVLSLTVAESALNCTPWGSYNESALIGHRRCSPLMSIKCMRYWARWVSTRVKVKSLD